MNKYQNGYENENIGKDLETKRYTRTHQLDPYKGI